MIEQIGVAVRTRVNANRASAKTVAVAGAPSLVWFYERLRDGGSTRAVRVAP